MDVQATGKGKRKQDGITLDALEARFNMPLVEVVNSYSPYIIARSTRAQTELYP